MHKQAFSAAAKQQLKEGNKLDVKYVKRKQLAQYLPPALLQQMRKVGGGRWPCARRLSVRDSLSAGRYTVWIDIVVTGSESMPLLRNSYVFTTRHVRTFNNHKVSDVFSVRKPGMWSRSWSRGRRSRHILA